MTWNDVHKALEDMKKLPDDWDGEGSDAPSTLAIDKALWVAKELEETKKHPPDWCHAGYSGNVYLEWRDWYPNIPSPNRVYMEIEISRDGVIEWRNAETKRIRP